MRNFETTRGACVKGDGRKLWKGRKGWKLWKDVYTWKRMWWSESDSESRGGKSLLRLCTGLLPAHRESEEVACKSVNSEPDRELTAPSSKRSNFLIILKDCEKHAGDDATMETLRCDYCTESIQ